MDWCSAPLLAGQRVSGRASSDPRLAVVAHSTHGWVTCALAPSSVVAELSSADQSVNVSDKWTRAQAGLGGDLSAHKNRHVAQIHSKVLSRARSKTRAIVKLMTRSSGCNCHAKHGAANLSTRLSSLRAGFLSGPRTRSSSVEHAHSRCGVPPASRPLRARIASVGSDPPPSH